MDDAGFAYCLTDVTHRREMRVLLAEQELELELRFSCAQLGAFADWVRMVARVLAHSDTDVDALSTLMRGTPHETSAVIQNIEALVREVRDARAEACDARGTEEEARKMLEAPHN